MEAPEGEGSWATALTHELINSVAAAGFNTIRIPIVWDRPTYRTHRVKGSKIHVLFDHMGQGLRLSEGDSVKGFAIAGADGTYYPANAKIQGNAVVVWSDRVSTPTALQYAWADYSQVNLYNSVHLPALPCAIEVQ